MTGQEIHAILLKRGVTQLHHANSVKTSLSFLKLGGLASRQRVEQERLPQTVQITDKVDRECGIWGDVFADTVDIHARVSDRNKYGPVLFSLGIDLLNSLPPTSRVLVTRSNPSKWDKAMSDEQRYFLNPADLTSGLGIGNLDHMLVIRTDGGFVPFGNHLQAIVLDDPILTGTGPEFQRAFLAITNAAAACGVQAEVARRTCGHRCKCIASYAEKSNRIHFFYNFS